MRKITKKASDAFWSFKNMSNSNTRIEHEKDDEENVIRSKVFLFNNLIIWRDFFTPDGQNCDIVKINFRGWNTPTTRERVNGILNNVLVDNFVQRNFGLWWGWTPIDPSETNEVVIF